MAIGISLAFLFLELALRLLFRPDQEVVDVTYECRFPLVHLSLPMTPKLVSTALMASQQEHQPEFDSLQYPNL